jgi:hypothetical protein
LEASPGKQFWRPYPEKKKLTKKSWENDSSSKSACLASMSLNPSAAKKKNQYARKQ